MYSGYTFNGGKILQDVNMEELQPWGKLDKSVSLNKISIHVFVNLAMVMLNQLLPDSGYLMY